jgi:hypothetical protein
MPNVHAAMTNNTKRDTLNRGRIIFIGSSRIRFEAGLYSNKYLQKSLVTAAGWKVRNSNCMQFGCASIALFDDGTHSVRQVCAAQAPASQEIEPADESVRDRSRRWNGR